MSAYVHEAWLVVDCDAADAVPVEIAIGKATDFRPAFRDYHDGKRTAKIRAGELTGRHRVYLKVNGTISEAGIASF